MGVANNSTNNFVYKYVYKGEVIYVGKTNGPLERRLYQHGRSGDNIDSKHHEKLNNSTIYYFEAANSIMADVIESELIRRYKPKLNKAKTSDWTGLDFPELKWKRYVPEHTVRRVNTRPHVQTQKQIRAIEDGMKSLYGAKMRAQHLINFADTEDMKMPVSNEYEILFFMQGAYFDIDNSCSRFEFYGINPPVSGLYDIKKNQFYVTYSVSRLKKWLSDDLFEFESELNRIRKNFKGGD